MKPSRRRYDFSIESILAKKRGTSTTENPSDESGTTRFPRENDESKDTVKPSSVIDCDRCQAFSYSGHSSPNVNDKLIDGDSSKDSMTAAKNIKNVKSVTTRNISQRQSSGVDAWKYGSFPSDYRVLRFPRATGNTEKLHSNIHSFVSESNPNDESVAGVFSETTSRSSARERVTKRIPLVKDDPYQILPRAEHSSLISEKVVDDSRKRETSSSFVRNSMKKDCARGDNYVRIIEIEETRKRSSFTAETTFGSQSPCVCLTKGNVEEVNHSTNNEFCEGFARTEKGQSDEKECERRDDVVGGKGNPDADNQERISKESVESSSKRVEAEFNETCESSRSSNKLIWLEYTRYRPPRLPRRSRRHDEQHKRKPSVHPRIPFSSMQTQYLEAKFRRTAYPTKNQLHEISFALKLSHERVKIWFQNRRARERRESEKKET